MPVDRPISRTAAGRAHVDATFQTTSDGSSIADPAGEPGRLLEEGRGRQREPDHRPPTLAPRPDPADAEDHPGQHPEDSHNSEVGAHSTARSSPWMTIALR